MPTAASLSPNATLPAGLWVLLWWKPGTISWKSDVLPLVPFFLAGLAAGLFAAGIEEKIFGPEGREFNFSFIERCLIAGRSLWFHLSKLFWPVDLAFMYRRWEISRSVWWQYLISRGGANAAGGVLGAAAVEPGTAGGGLILRRHALSGTGLFQCLFVSVFVRERSPSILGEPGDDCVGIGRGGRVAGAVAALGPGSG